MRRPRSWPRFMAVLLMFGCCSVAPSCVGLDAARTRADRATFDWVAPMFRRYVTDDEGLDAWAKATHLRSLEAWGERISEFEEAGR